jgi:signal peptidase II
VSSEPARKVEFRPGARTDGLAPISVAARSLAAQPVHWLSLTAVAVAALVADQLTKHVVASQVRLDDEVEVIGPFSIHHVQNSGIAFGLFASATAAVIILTTIAVGWMVGYFARSGARHPLLPVAVGLLIGGSVSNLTDRVRLGHVTDFLDFRYWPAFNLADSFIVIGVAVLLGALVAADRRPRRPRARAITTRP